MLGVSFQLESEDEQVTLTKNEQIIIEIFVDRA